MSFLEPIPSVEEMTNYVLDNLMTGFTVKGKEICPYRHSVRFDIAGINRNKREVRIFEVKSCRRDFTSDKKWQTYLPFCTHFAFVAPKGVIKLDELPEGVGLVEFWNQEHTSYKGELYHVLTHQYTRGCKQLQAQPDNEHYISLLEGIVMRLITETKEFRQYWQIRDDIEDMKNQLYKISQQIGSGHKP